MTALDARTWQAVVAGLLVAAFWIWLTVKTSRRRSFLRLLPGLAAILLPIVLLIGLVIRAVAAHEDMDFRVQQAIIAAVVIASGWIATFLLQEYRRSDERDERLRDMHRTLFADISSFLEGAGSRQDLADYARTVRDARTGDPAFEPFFPLPYRSRIFEALSLQIHVLPRITIDPVVLFYTQLDTLHGFVEDMRTDSFADLPRDRRWAAYEDYFRMMDGALELGVIARSVIDKHDNEGLRAAKRFVADRISNRSAASSDR